MTLVAYLAGDDEAHRVRIGSTGGDFLGLETHADGSVGFGTIVFDDPDKSLVTRGWMDVVVEETDCVDAPVLYHGLLGDRKITRSFGDTTYKSGGSRFIACNVIDGNDLLTFRMFVNPDAKRKAEGDDRRIRYALGGAVGAVFGLVDDDGLVHTAPNPFQEGDYRGQYAENMIEDMADALGKIKFVYTDPVTAEWHLFYDFPTQPIADCPIAISNDMADTSEWCLYPLIDASQSLDPSEMASQVRYVYLNGVVLEGNTDTYTDFFSAAATGGPDLGNRGINIESDRVGEEDTARHHAQAYLNEHSVERDTITVAFIVPSTQIGLVRSGQRISNKFTHLDGHESFTWSRIQNVNIQHWTTNKEYVVICELTNAAGRGTGGTGGGSTGGFPTPPPAAPAIVQVATENVPGLGGGSFTVTLDNPPGNGVLVCWQDSRGSPYVSPPTGWTVIGTNTPGADYSRLMWRPAVPGESPVIDVLTTMEPGGWATVWELPAGYAVDDDSTDEADTGTMPATVDAGTLAPTERQSAILLMGLAIHSSDFIGQATFLAAGAGWTQDAQSWDDSHPLHFGAHQLVTSTTGTYATTTGLSGFSSNFGGWAGRAIAFVADTSGNPPLPGQEVPREVPVYDPDGPAYTFRTAHAFADQTLHLFVDTLPMDPSIVDYDGACGVFQMAFLPETGEKIEVTYQGRAG